jgi:hypothetical protein
MGLGRNGGLAGDTKGLQRFRTGATIGISGAVAGLALPVALNLFAAYDPSGTLTSGATLIELTTIFLLAGAILLAISLIFYRSGFAAFRKLDRWFLTASVLCVIGSIGLLLVVLSAAFALASTPTLAQCIRGAPSHALSCLRAIQPLTAYSVLVGFWLAWLGGLGVVVGVELGGRRFREVRLIGAGVAYALLLLVLIDPFLALLFPIGGWQYPLLLGPILALVAPALVSAGSRRLLSGG